MQAFGLELRRTGSVGNLYQDVDKVLSNYSIPNGGVTRQLQAQACAHALQDMMKVDKWFNICTIDQCVKVAQIVIPVERYRIYHAAHCISWNNMLPDFRQQLIAMVLDDFRSVLNPQA